MQVSGPGGDTTQPTTISGRVLNASTGTPVARALVRFNDHAMLTGYDGKFEFDQVTESGGSLQVTKPGFYASLEPGSPSGTYLQTNQIAGPLELRLYPEALFTGTLTAPDGDPLPHILVMARRSEFTESGHLWVPVAQTQSDAHGRFRLTVPAGDYKLESMYVPRVNGTDKVALPLEVPAESSSNTSGMLHIRSGEEQHFDLHPSVRRAYTVTASYDSDEERGYPRVVAHSSDGTSITLPVRLSRSQEPNAARMELPSGTYTLSATVMTTDGMEEGDTTVTVTDHDVSGVVFHLAPLPSLPVEMSVDQAATSDNPPRLIQLGLMLERSDPDVNDLNGSISLSMRRDGSMSFLASPGSYRLHVRNNGSNWYIKSASYGATDILDQDIVLAPGAGGTPLRITVSDQTAQLDGTCKLGGALATCWVYLIPTGPSATTVFMGRSEADGAFRFAHLPPGSYRAVAFEQRHSTDYSNPASLAAYASHVQTLTVSAGGRSTLDLDGISEREMVP